jgi:hypothetical protein
MNSLESRIHAAARAAADEVTPADIPPLRLPPRPRGLRAAGRRRMRAGAGQPQRSSRWLAPLAAAVSLASVLAGLVVLRTAVWPGRDSTLPTSATLSRTQKLLARQALDAFFPATGRQYTTGLAFAWTRQEILAAKAGTCLSQAGFSPSAFPASRRRYQLAFPANAQFPDLAQRARTHTMAPAGGDARSDRARPWAHADKSRYATAARSCMARHARSLWRLDTIATPLASAWLKQVARIQASAPVRAKRAGFVSCLESFGVPASFANSSGAHSHRLFTGFFAWMGRLGASNGSAQRYASQQRLWTPVFVTCARPTVMTTERLQVAARSTFLAAHAAQIRTIKRIVVRIAASWRRPAA